MGERSLMALSLVMFYLAFATTRLWFLCFIFLTPLFIGLLKCEPRTPLGWGWRLYALVFCMVCLLPVVQIEPNSWSGQLSYFASVFSVLAWIIISGVLSFIMLAFFKLFSIIKFHISDYLLVLIASLGWVVFEIMRLLVFSVLTHGDGGSVGVHWPFGIVGLPAMYSPLALLAKYVGLFGVSLIVVYINIQLAFWIYYRRKVLTPKSVLLAVLCASIAVLCHLRIAPESTVLKDFDIEVVSFDRHQYVDSSYLGRFSGRGFDLIVLPEYSGIDERTDFSVLDEGTWIISTYLEEGMPSRNIMFAANRDGIQQTYDKNFLIPSGEYLPYLIEWPLELFGQKKMLYDFKSAHSIDKGSSDIYPFDINGVKVGALACSGVLDGYQYDDLVARGAEVLVNTASLSFLADDSDYHVTNKYLAKYYSMSSDLSFAQASRTGGSYIILR